MREKRNSRINEIKWNLIGIFGKLFIDLLFSTTRIESIGFERVRPLISSRKFIGAVWHSRILLLSYLYKGLNAAILVSGSEDGEIVARIIQRQGHEAIRGSTTRGGLRALSRLVKTIKERNRVGAVIPDGPRGRDSKFSPESLPWLKRQDGRFCQ